MNKEDIKKQALWEFELEQFERAVQKEKEKLYAKKHFFPWRLRFINLNKGATK